MDLRERCERCEHCLEPTKFVTGFWDGINLAKNGAVHGNSYSCKQYACPLRLAEEEAFAASDKRRIEVVHANKANGVSATVLEQARLAAHATIRELSAILGVAPSMYCKYRDEQEPIPHDLYSDALSWLELVSALAARAFDDPDDPVENGAKTSKDYKDD